MIRAMDFNGENELSGDIELMCCLIVARLAGWKILGSVSLVIRSVLDGGAGDDRPGSEDRSIDSGDLDRFPDSEPGEDVAEAGGETCKPLVASGGSCVAVAMSGLELMSCASSCDSCFLDALCGGGTGDSMAALHYISFQQD